MCTLIRYLGFMGGGGVVCLFVVFFKLLSWMFQHDCLDTCCFECLAYMCFAFVHLAPVQRS